METDRISSTGVGATEPQQQGQQQQQGPQEQLEEQQEEEEEVWVAEDYICSKFPWPLADRDMTTIVTHRTLPGVAVRACPHLSFSCTCRCRTRAHRCLYRCR